MSTYEPFFVPSDFWTYKENMIMLNETTPNVTVNIHLKTMSVYKFQIMRSMDMSNSLYAEWGISQDQDMLKKMMTETNFYLLILTMTVGLLHTVFEVLAFKNDIHFWKDRDSVRGISVRSLFINLSMSFVIFLYLMDSEDTSMMILMPAGVGIFIELWKISKACKVTAKSSFPFISIKDRDTYDENDT